MDRTGLIITYLTEWQGKEMMTDKEVDITIFNAVGIIIGMLNTGLMSTIKLHDFVELLNLGGEDGSKKLTGIIVEAYDYANKTKEVGENG